MSPKSLGILKKYFQLFGFHFATHRQSRYLTGIFVIHILLALSFTITVIDYGIFQGTILKARPLRTINHIFPIASLLAAYWIIVFESYLKRKQHHTFWNIVNTMGMPKNCAFSYLLIK